MSIRRSDFTASVTGSAPIPREIAFLARHEVNSETLRQAARVAERCGVSADVALLRCGLIDEERFYRTLAIETGLPYRPDAAAAHRMARFPNAALSGLLPLAGDDGEPVPPFAYAPRGAQVVRLLDEAGQLTRRPFIAGPGWIRDRLLVARAGPIAAAAADGLARASPHLSYRGGASARQHVAAALVGAGATASFLLAPALTGFVAATLLGTAFLGHTALRLAAVLEPVRTEPARPLPRIPDRDLPVYTLLVPLHRERRVLPKLIRALEALDYPAPKLDIKLILEADDADTRDALRNVRLPGFVEVVLAPPGEPRTKPRALNVALPLARGTFVAVYDAEDVPEPGQLRLAVSLFERSAPDVGCLQARLVIDNAGDSLLTRLFAIEYSTLFDVTNPALARCDLPVPLGGTSNHFRTAILRALGGWDAWNVTEDADLGMRLAAAGYRVADLPSATLEEAPRRLRAWMNQRTRWMKGFIQVTITHSRRPVETWRRLGAVRAFGAAAVSAGTVASAFGFPVFMGYAAAEIASGRLLGASSLPDAWLASLGATLFAAGLAALLLPPLAALRRRRWLSLLPLVPLMPFYYCLVSFAAWRGLVELLVAPHRWNKTEHGLALTSRANGPGAP